MWLSRVPASACTETQSPLPPLHELNPIIPALGGGGREVRCSKSSPDLAITALSEDLSSFPATTCNSNLREFSISEVCGYLHPCAQNHTGNFKKRFKECFSAFAEDWSSACNTHVHRITTASSRESQAISLPWHPQTSGIYTN